MYYIISRNNLVIPTPEKKCNLKVTITEKCGYGGSNLTAEVEGGVPPYKYEWSTGEKTSSILSVPYNSVVSLTVSDSDNCQIQTTEQTLLSTDCQCTLNSDCLLDGEGICTCGTNSDAGICQGKIWLSDFENGVSGWFQTGVSPITRVVSGTNGINTKDGSGWYGVIPTNPSGANGIFTRFGGYSNIFGSGRRHSVLIYLDMTQNTVLGTDLRADYSIAQTTTSCGFMRDFIFSIGTDPLVVGQFAMSAGNNTPGWPSGNSPIFVSTSGWYTFNHEFIDDAGVLRCNMEVRSPSDVVLGTWSLSNGADLIVNCGGNRYGWFIYNEFPFLAIDNVLRENF